MYTSHVYHPKNTKNYISVGDPYVKAKAAQRSNFKGTQFHTKFPKKGQVAGYFSTYEYKTSPYQQNTNYLKEQPRENRKMGFGSYDAFRCGEFTLDIRSRQYKEKLAHEEIYNEVALKKAKDMRKRRPGTAPPVGRVAQEKYRQKKYREQYKDNPHMFQTQVPFNLFDIGRDSYTPVCNKCKRDTFYCPHRIGRGAFNARRPGTASTLNSTYGKFGPNHVLQNPKYGNSHATDSFNDKSHIMPGDVL